MPYSWYQRLWSWSSSEADEEQKNMKINGVRIPSGTKAVISSPGLVADGSLGGRYTIKLVDSSDCPDCTTKVKPGKILEHIPHPCCPLTARDREPRDNKACRVWLRCGSFKKYKDSGEVDEDVRVKWEDDPPGPNDPEPNNPEPNDPVPITIEPEKITKSAPHKPDPSPPRPSPSPPPEEEFPGYEHVPESCKELYRACDVIIRPGGHVRVGNVGDCTALVHHLAISDYECELMLANIQNNLGHDLARDRAERRR
eukprot:TRINITY_DN400_c0_g1_i1.p1 TRINITY_DN400_c0_g1~~TRINITY_DN400_c0_g1_i1.p1  ORF type:complete len:255 (-),score=28.53 TRINITY_DN400_c0_g1_i1:107-871(-)